MATYEITGVKVAKTIQDPHEHITGAELSNRSDQRFLRSTIVGDIKDPNGDRYYTYAGGERAEVIVVECPRCSRDDYITTTPDTTTANNLLKLKRYT